MNRRFTTITVLVLAVALFFAVNLIAGAALRSTRLDLTEGSLYTLASGSRSVARKVAEPIRLTLFYSQDAARGIPQVQAYATRVREVLEQYALDSGGKITVEVVDPEPFSDSEDRAVQAGVAAVPVGSGDPIYFGLLGTNSTDGREAIPSFDPSQEQFLEYQVAKLIYTLDNPTRRVVGLITPLPMGAYTIDPRTGQPQPQLQWQVLTQARSVFEVRELQAPVNEIPGDVNVLWIAHPKDLPQRTLYAIDQFVLRGGHAVVFVDPHCEADQPQGMRGFEAMLAPRASDMPRLFEAWGLELASSSDTAREHLIAADKTYALSVPTQPRGESVTHILYMAFSSEAMESTDPVTGSLGTVNMGTAGHLKKRDGATTTFTPLIQTSDQAMTIGLEKVRFMPDPKELLASYVPGGQRLTVAARVAGNVKTAFPDGAPTPAEGEDPPPAPAEHLAQSTAPINVIVVADADMLTDNFWVQNLRLGDVSLGYQKFGDNGDLLLGALDNLTGSGDLIAIRARGKFTRPFTRVAEMRKAAEGRYRAEQQSLETKIRETEQRISELQQQRPGEQQSGLILTPEQEAELTRLREEMVQTRRALRDVRHNLDKDIESLQNRLLVVNAGLIPLVVTLAAVGLGAARVARRRASRSSTRAG